MKHIKYTIFFVILLSHAAIKATENNQPDNSWAAHANSACKIMAASIASYYAGAFETTMILSAFDAFTDYRNRQIQKGLFLTASAVGLGYIFYATGNQTITSTLGNEQLDVAKTSAAVGAASAIVSHFTPFGAVPGIRKGFKLYLD